MEIMKDYLSFKKIMKRESNQIIRQLNFIKENQEKEIEKLKIKGEKYEEKKRMN